MITLPLRRSLLTLLAITLAIALINGLFGVDQYVGGSDNTGRLYAFFDLNSESNFPTWFSAALLLGSGLVAAAIAYLKSQLRAPLRWYWWGVSATFFYLSVDEAAQVHENWGDITPTIDNLGGAFYFGWVVPGTALVALFLILFAGFIAQLPRRALVNFTLAGTTYLVGAIGMEMLGAYVLTSRGSGVITGLVVIAEESLEQIGAILFLYALLDYLRAFTPDLIIRQT